MEPDKSEDCAGHAVGETERYNMKAFITLVAVSAAMLLLLMNTPPAFASSGWGSEDPQLCVNGQLLTIVPAGPADVFVAVPNGAAVDYKVQHCGGNPAQDIVESSHVTFQSGSVLRATADVVDGTTVTFQWGLQVVSAVAEDGEASATFATN
jgi:hypothetical protein